MAYVSAASAVVGLAMSAYGMYAQGDQQKKMYDYQAKIAERDATLAGYAAQDAQRRGEIEEKQKRLQISNLIGSQKTAYAGAGVDVGGGSPLETTADTAAWGEWDAQTIRHNTAREVWGIKNQQQNAMIQSGLYQVAGANAYQKGMWSAGGSVLEGAGTVADKWYRGSESGAWKTKPVVFGGGEW